MKTHCRFSSVKADCKEKKEKKKEKKLKKENWAVVLNEIWYLLGVVVDIYIQSIVEKPAKAVSFLVRTNKLPIYGRIGEPSGHKFVGNQSGLVVF